MDDSELKAVISECLGGKSESFNRIVEAFQNPIFHFAYQFTRNSDEAGDATMEIFFKAYRALDSFKPRYRFSSWLYKIAVNESINHIKSKKQTVKLNYDFESQERTPEENVSQGARVDLLQNALKTLNLDYRVVIVMKYFLELSYNEISENLEIPVKTVKSRLFTARQLLKEILVK